MKQESAATLAETWHFRAREIYLAVEFHENPHGLQLLFLSRRGKALICEFVVKVFDGVGEDLKRTSGLRGNQAAAVGAFAVGRGD
jgi:hypothetical protein